VQDVAVLGFPGDDAEEVQGGAAHDDGVQPQPPLSEEQIEGLEGLPGYMVVSV
jgi:hypothetical protein